MSTRIRMLALAAVAATLCFVTDADAAAFIVQSTVTTSHLAGICGPDSAKLDADLCTGYVLASFDSLAFDQKICPSKGVTTEQVMAIGRHFLNAHPDIWDKAPQFVLREAMTTAFPCVN